VEEDLIRSRLSNHIDLANKLKNEDPRNALLNCRMATEAILMNIHYDLVRNDDCKNIITLGEAHSKALGLFGKFDPLQLSSIEFINKATSQYLHFNYREPEMRTDLVDRVLAELEYLIDTCLDVEKSHDNTMQKEPVELPTDAITPRLNWKHALEEELGYWPDFYGRLLTKDNLKRWLESYRKGMNMSFNPEQTHAASYVKIAEPMLEFTMEELIQEERRLIKSLLVYFYQTFGGPTYNQREDGFNLNELREVMLDSGWPCSPRMVADGGFNGIKYLNKPMPRSQWEKAREIDPNATKIGFTLVHKWEFMYLK
jgi:hypothetical protein